MIEQASHVSIELDLCNKFDNSIELPILPGIVKGIWKQVSYTIYREVEEVSESSSQAEIKQEPAEAEDSSEEQDDDIEEIIAEMHQLLKNQKMSKAKKYEDIIRESIEFTLDDEEEFEGSNSKDQDKPDDQLKYGEIKQQVLQILQRKMDRQEYKETIKSCKKTAKKATDTWCLGQSRKIIKAALKRIVSQP